MTTPLEIVLFDVGGITCALRRGSIRELLPLPRLWHPPGAPRPLAGFFNLGGLAVPVIALTMLFGLEAKEGNRETLAYRHLILVEGPAGKAPFAFLVDRVLDLIRLDENRLSPVHEGGTLNGCVESEIDLGGTE